MSGRRAPACPKQRANRRFRRRRTPPRAPISPQTLGSRFVELSAAGEDQVLARPGKTGARGRHHLSCPELQMSRPGGHDRRHADFERRVGLPNTAHCRRPIPSSWTPATGPDPISDSIPAGSGLRTPPPRSPPPRRIFLACSARVLPNWLATDRFVGLLHAAGPARRIRFNTCPRARKEPRCRSCVDTILITGNSRIAAVPMAVPPRPGKSRHGSVPARPADRTERWALRGPWSSPVAPSRPEFGD